LLQEELQKLRESLVKRDTDIEEYTRKLKEKQDEATTHAKERNRLQKELFLLRKKPGEKGEKKQTKRAKVAVMAEIVSAEESQDGCDNDDGYEDMYSWSSTVDTGSEQCLVLYGFTAPQLEKLDAMTKPLQEAAHKVCGRGRKAWPFDRHRALLTVLHYFVYYPTLRQLSERFSVGMTGLSMTLMKQLSVVLPSLFELSASLSPAKQQSNRKNSPRLSHATGAYFLTLCKPQNPVAAAALWAASQEDYGQWIHCVHDVDGGGKVIAFQVTSQAEPDAKWLETFKPLLDATPAKKITQAYEARLRGKFAIASARYRGTADESEAMVRVLLALCNLDIAFDNPVIVGEEDNNDESNTQEFS
jgi:hypothetical protein